jgi:hypothetical protein
MVASKCFDILAPIFNEHMPLVDYMNACRGPMVCVECLKQVSDRFLRCAQCGASGNHTDGAGNNACTATSIIKRIQQWMSLICDPKSQKPCDL